ncbi:MAG: alpha/beta fold hydrolase [Ilumatobacteraceae bacterium]
MTYARATDGIRLHYETVGRRSGPPVLLIQGLGTDKHGWDLQRFVLAPKYRTIALDNRGSGRSDKPFGEYSLEQMADDAISVLDHAGIESAHVVGASMGGAISQVLALKYPDRVRSLTLACTACRHHPWRRELLNEWASTASERGMGAMAGEAARWVIGPRSFRRAMPLIGWFGPLAFGRPAHAFVAQVRAILATDDALADELLNLDLPTLILVGNQDILTPRGDSEELAERIKGSELVVISGAAHGLMMEHATTFNRLLLDFLGRTVKAQKMSVGGAHDADVTDIGSVTSAAS